ncbi:MAG: LamG-like jellyroll fold domain-containing protein [Verrucomicrobiota bacterium JB024]|nr:LamG-like jellyroll fold domain-containing protein [Verrucomicrobiota bacterium JB024]
MNIPTQLRCLCLSFVLLLPLFAAGAGIEVEPEAKAPGVDYKAEQALLVIPSTLKGPYQVKAGAVDITGDENFAATVEVERLERLAASGECEANLVIEFANGEIWKWGYNAREKVIVDAHRGEELIYRNGWTATAPTGLKVVRIGQSVFFEQAGRLVYYRPLEGRSVSRLWLEVDNRTGQGADIRLSGIEVSPLGTVDAPTAPYARPFAKKVFMNVLGWMPPEKFPATFAEQYYDFPALPVADGIRGQVEAMGKHGVDAVLLDFLGTKRPSMILPQFDMSDAWLKAIRESSTPQMQFAPFWEYDSGGADPYHSSAGIGTDNLADAARFVADIIEYNYRRYQEDPELYRLQGRPVDFLYNSMIYNEPEFWRDVRAHLTDSLGMAPIFSLGPGGLPMTLHAEFDPDYFHRYTDEYFESVFVFNLWGPTADVFPGKIMDHYRDREPPVQVIGTAVPGYWSVRHNHRTIVHPRFTERLRESLGESLAADVDGVHVTTWNDFWENTHFVPSFSFLDSRLEVLSAMTAKWKGEPARDGASRMPRAILSYRKVVYPGEPIDFELLFLPTEGFGGETTATVRFYNEDGAELFAGRVEASVSDDLVPVRASEVGEEWVLPRSFPQKTAITVEAVIEQGGEEFACYNLPQIAVLPFSFLDPDLLLYSVPLHRLIPDGTDAELEINGELAGTVTTDGLVGYRLAGGEDGLQFAVTRNSHAVRMMADAELAGSEFFPGRNSKIVLQPNRYECFIDAMSDQGRRPMVPEIQNWRAAKSLYPIELGGDSYYAALVLDAEGHYAYTPIVWTQFEREGARCVGSYVFNGIEQGYVRNRSAAGRDIEFGTRANNPKTVFLRPDFPVMAWGPETGPVSLPIDFLPPAAASVECVFRFEHSGEPQVILGQSHHSRQLDLRINEADQFVLSRVDETGQSVELISPVLKPGVVHQVVGVYDGLELRLYVNGVEVDSAPCRGVRTGEGIWLGGIGDERFQGELVRMNVFNGALSADQVEAMHERLELLELNAPN